MHIWPKIIVQILNNPTIIYISMISAIVFIYQQQTCMFATIRAIFISLCQSRQSLKKSVFGNNIYLFLNKPSFISLSSQIYFFLFSTHTYSIKAFFKKGFWSVESKFIPCYAVTKLQN